LNKIVNNYSNSVALDRNPEPDLVHATGCKQPSLRYTIRLNDEPYFFRALLGYMLSMK
jgi:hypothetical protein